MIKNLLLLFLLIITAADAQVHTLSGLVLDSETLQPLPSATLRIIGGTKGTVTNSAGQFRLSLQSQRYEVAVSYLGYQSDTVSVEMSSDQFRAVRLLPNAIELSGVTVTDEDPAYEIIRRAVESKKKWMAQLRTFEGKAFTRTQIRTDSSIAAITESYSTLYWTRDDSIREVITQQKQTGNIPAGMFASRAGEVVNFNDDRIKMGGFVFIGPTAPNAFDYYDYRLLSTRKMDDFEVYTIRIEPRSKITPLFKGTISIAERSYAVMEVDVMPNEAFNQPFVNVRHSRYRQSFRLFENKFWLMSGFRFDGLFKISIAGIALPSFGIERDLVIYEYAVNPQFADTIKQLKKLTVDSSATLFDSTFWSANAILPLTQEQDSAYRTLDSTQSLAKKFAPTGPGLALLGFVAGGIGMAEVWFTRVEGLHLGVNPSFRDVVKGLDVRASLGYGFADRQWKYGAGATYSFGGDSTARSGIGFANIILPTRPYSISLDVYDKHKFFPEPLLPGLLLNSLSALFEKEDVHDYYRVIGGSSTLTAAPNRHVSGTVTVLSERHLSVYQNTNYSIINRHKQYPFQPAIAEGRMNSLTVSATYSTAQIFSFEKEALSITAKAEHSSALIGSDFEFTKLSGKLRGKFATMLKEETVFPPTFGFQISASVTPGHLPPQRYSELYSRFETFAGYGSLKGLKRRQFYGDSYLSFTADHNFRKMLFAPLGIQWLMESNLELILEGNAARSWLSGRELRSPLFPVRDSGGWYYEASIGLSNVLDLFRIDLTRRLTAPTDWVVSLTISDFLAGLFAL